MFLSFKKKKRSHPPDMYGERLMITGSSAYWSMSVICVQAVSEDSEKIGAEELQCKAMAANAQRDLDEALPALAEAMKVCFADDAFAFICLQ